MALIKLVGKNFAVHQKSAKTAKVFFHVGFVAYGIATLFFLNIPLCKLSSYSTLSMYVQ